MVFLWQSSGNWVEKGRILNGNAPLFSPKDGAFGQSFFVFRPDLKNKC